jgi:hypothetical protein
LHSCRIEGRQAAVFTDNGQQRVVFWALPLTCEAALRRSWTSCRTSASRGSPFSAATTRPTWRAPRETGIAESEGDLSQADKLTWIRRAQAGGQRVLMVGDGLDDGPVPAAADASFAFADATDQATRRKATSWRSPAACCTSAR